MYRLSLKQVAERRRQNIRKMTSDNLTPIRKKKVTISNMDFKPLQEKLPEWINTELKKMEEGNNG